MSKQITPQTIKYQGKIYVKAEKVSDQEVGNRDQR